MKQDFPNYQCIHYSHHADTFVYTTYLCMPVYIFVMQNMENLHQIDIFCTLAYHSFCSLISLHLSLYPFWYLWLSALHYAVDLTKKFCIQKLGIYYCTKWMQ